jgi:hypothetical protein
MIIQGKVKNGVVVIEDGTALPEGAAVGVCYPAPVTSAAVDRRQRVEVPLVRTARPGSVRLTGERIAQILDDEDAAARR